MSLSESNKKLRTAQVLAWESEDTREDSLGSPQPNV